MKVMAVDPNPVELIRLSESIRKTTPPGTSVECFHDPFFAYQYALKNPNQTDALYTVAQMPRLSGFDLTRQMRKANPELHVWLLWDNDEYREDAKRLGVDGYIIRPATIEALKKAQDEADDGEK